MTRKITVEPFPHHVTARFAGETLVDTEQALILSEQGLKPVLYFPRDGVVQRWLVPTQYTTFCPYKGEARYWAVKIGDRLAENALWSYEEPLPQVADIAGRQAFYWNDLDEWRVDGEPVDDAAALAALQA